MTEAQLIEILWQFVGWSATVLGVLIGVIYGGLVSSIRKLGRRVDACATRTELEKFEEDIVADRERSDNVVNSKLNAISEGVSQTHRRIDDLFKLLVNR